ncbi:hypothetical protein EDD18DRAFT_1099669 [Armillaria luteobubalina]|uniref:Uncharacterized protein n=1 Tax=Armillaria luteobubalina TaxID=153913 RepID=A0AA39V3U2_9AGAR|nr:hypothetical protein EDD18DRAFT_1099669 [Armillaria luteobubalina]
MTLLKLSLATGSCVFVEIASNTSFSPPPLDMLAKAESATSCESRSTRELDQKTYVGNGEGPSQTLLGKIRPFDMRPSVRIKFSMEQKEAQEVPAPNAPVFQQFPPGAVNWTDDAALTLQRKKSGRGYTSSSSSIPSVTARSLQLRVAVLWHYFETLFVRALRGSSSFFASDELPHGSPQRS